MTTNSQSALGRDTTTTIANGHATINGPPAEIALDITEPPRAEQALKTNQRRMQRQNEAFQAAISDAPLEESLAILARIVTDTDPAARFGFHIADRDAACLHPIRIHGGGIPDSYMDAVDNFPIGEDSLGCGLALATGDAVVTPDVFEDARWKKMNVLDLPRAHGWRACWSFPIVTANALPVGTFYRYFADRREPTPDDLAATEMVTQAAAIIIRGMLRRSNVRRLSIWRAPARNATACSPQSSPMCPGRPTPMANSSRLRMPTHAIPANRGTSCTARDGCNAFTPMIARD